jgi:hypothetical protein
MATVQYRVVFGKKDEVVEGPDDADIVLTVPAAEAATRPEVAYMQGRLKAAGNTGALFDLFRSGEVSANLSRLASRP